MLAGYENSPKVRNQYGVEVPLCMIHIDAEVHVEAVNKVEKKHSGDPYSENVQEFGEFVFEHHKKKFSEEHEANLCKDDDEVWRMHMKHRYKHLKEMVHRKGKDTAVDLFDYPDDSIYMGAYVQKSNVNGKLSQIESSVQVYHVHPAFTKNDGFHFFEIYLDDFQRLAEKVNEVLKGE